MTNDALSIKSLFITILNPVKFELIAFLTLQNHPSLLYFYFFKKKYIKIKIKKSIKNHFFDFFNLPSIPFNQVYGRKGSILSLDGW